MLVAMTVYAVMFTARNKKKLAEEERERQEVQARFGITDHDKEKMEARR